MYFMSFCPQKQQPKIYLLYLYILNKYSLKYVLYGFRS